MAFTIVAAQVAPLQINGSLELFERQCEQLIEANPEAAMLIFPEMHLFADGEPDLARSGVLRASAEPLDGPRVLWLKNLARRLGVWLVPGSICELGAAGELFNTAIVLSPAGQLHAVYRKIFPWRPSEPYTPGQKFTVFDIPEAGRFGLCICFDSWFPEVSRNLAWLGAQTILNVVKTTTNDRPQEMVIARANAIVNQVNFLTVNAAGPVGTGQSAFFGPQGEVLAEVDGVRQGTMVCHVSTDAVLKARREGTAGVTQPWAFFQQGDNPVELPAYEGRIDPTSWNR